MFMCIFIKDRWSIAGDTAVLFIVGGATDYVAHQDAADRKYIPICTILSLELDKPQTFLRSTHVLSNNISYFTTSQYIVFMI
jgi:hypothetical protein